MHSHSQNVVIRKHTSSNSKKRNLSHIRYYCIVMRQMLFLILLLWSIVELHAQPKGREDDFAQGTTTTQQKSRDRYTKERFTNRNKTYPQLVKYQSKGLLYGNLCAREISERMGFEYVIVPESVLSVEERLKDKGNNFKTNIKLIFKHGPWWKMTFNRRVKKCRRMTTDHNTR